MDIHTSVISILIKLNGLVSLYRKVHNKICFQRLETNPAVLFL